MTVPPDLRWLDALRDPRSSLDWPPDRWDTVVRLARRLRLLARLAEALAAEGLLDRVPPGPRRHLLAEQRLSAWRTQGLRWAALRIQDAAGDLGVPLVLLKGGAYVAQGLPIGAGRLPSDLDILVPRARLAEFRHRLLAAGWSEVPLDEHDQRYYHEWSHEVPPMQHPQQRIELDLHHNILPPLSRTPVDADRLLERLQPSGWDGWHVLHPVDQLLHSAAHLFHDSEARDRLRDLVDLDALLRAGLSRAGFESSLWPRAVELGLVESLALALHFCTRWLGTPVPDALLASAREHLPDGPRRTALLWVLAQVLTPAPLDRGPPLRQEIAAWLLAARYHAWRLPVSLLLPHLLHKWRVAHRPRELDAAAPQARDPTAG